METDPLSNILEHISSIAGSSALWYSIAVVLLLMTSALISGSETALFSITGAEREDFKHSKDPRERMIASLLERPDRLLATILIANNFVNIAIVLILEYLLRTYVDFGDNDILRVLISVVMTTFLLLLFGEVMPKVYATGNYLGASKMVVPIIKVMSVLLRVVSVPFLLLNKAMEKIFSHRTHNGHLSVDGLSQALEMTQDETNDEDDIRILEGIVSFGKTEAKQVMTPRTEVFSVADDCTFERLKRLILRQGYSRIPVYHGNPDCICGILYIKDLLAYLGEKDYQWQKMIRKPFFVPENRKIDDILVDFQEKKNHMAIVVDEYGGTSGLITMDDILEEIVGNISDEFDTESGDGYTREDENHFTFEGSTRLVDFYRILDLEADEEEMWEENKGEADTLAGLILERIGAFPKRGETITFMERYTFTVSAIDRKRIKEIKLEIAQETPATAEKEED